MDLDEFQKKAAWQDEKYSIIIAGAGTGKTYTLLGRIEYLIKHQNLKPEEIVVISYTNETVCDFKKKAFKHLGVSISVFTFHKLAISILNTLSISFSLCSNKELEFIVHEFLFSYCAQNSSLKKLVLGSFNFFGKYGFGSYQKLIETNELSNFQKDLIEFIHLWSSKGYSQSKLLEFVSKTHGKTKSFFLLIYFLIHCYISEKKSQALFDFDDLIEVTICKIKDLSSFPYKHILIDEFQDSSWVRIQFLKEIAKQFSLSFTVVGDDCQSIYGFSGTESNCFAILKELFPSIHTFYLKNTYRNSQELIQIANHFVLKNIKQMKKEILSSLHIEYPIEVLYYKSKSKMSVILKYILSQEISRDILFLGRNSFDLQYYFSDKEIQWTSKKTFTLVYFPNQEFSFLTVHQSKGLEADIVILLHMENSVYGFPNQIKMRKAFQMILPKEEIKFEEERRVFYVALTRTKGKIYLITPFLNPSCFIKEIIHDNKNKIRIKLFQ